MAREGDVCSPVMSRFCALIEVSAAQAIIGNINVQR
jgi:hypothetical protein